MSPEIHQARPDQWRESLELLLARDSEPTRSERIEHWLTEPQAGDNLAGLWIAEVDRQVIGTVLARPQAGRSATVWPARTITADRELAQRLANACLDWLGRSGAITAQALLSGTCDDDRQLLAAVGFAHVADLIFMVCFVPPAPPTDASELTDMTHLEFIPYEPAMGPRLASLLERTYIGSLDCPAIDGSRRIDDVLEEYAATGDGGTSGWFIARTNDQDLGCLLLAPDNLMSFTQIAYMGVVPEVRGRRIGSALVHRAQVFARASGHARLALAVDTANSPALLLYESMDFIAWEERSLFFRRMTSTK